MKLYGTQISQGYSYLAFKINQCFAAYHNNCESQNNIDYHLSGNYFQVLTVGEYFDPNDFDNPVKPYTHEDVYMHVYTDTFLSMTVYIRKNQYILNDSIFGFPWSERTGEFYSFEQGLSTSGERASGAIGGVYYQQHREMLIYERRVNTILNVFSGIGGMFELLIFWPSMFFGLCQKKTLHSMIANSINKRQKDQHSNILKREDVYREENSLNDNYELDGKV
jgi:hypothetical protein